MTIVTLRRTDSTDVITATARTTDPAEAIARVGRRYLGWPEIGSLQHFPGGCAYHVRFGRAVRTGGCSLSSLYVAHVTEG